MSGVSMAAIKELRERLGAGVTDSKNALVEAEGDIEKAIEILRLKGLKGVAKREGRSASEGLIAVKETSSSVTMIDLACETDFVAKNEKFIALGESVLEAVSDSNASDLDEALAASLGDKTVSEAIVDESAIIGEKLELRRVTRLDGEKFAVYLHKTSKDLPPQVGVIVSYTGDDEETARAIAQHISFADPLYVSRDDVPEAEVNKERDLVTEIAKNEGKPEVALPKIIEGRLTGFYKNVALLEQDYARDNKITVGKVAENAGLVIKSFDRFKVGA
ncbi:MAG TPA: translation elongation factor Ts [Microbacteriaceae bacterium]|nr:translation elongation factor Ts [Microbacteriaceae bacterium]